MTLVLTTLLGLAGAVHIAAFEFAGRSDLPPTGVAALTFLGLALGLLAVSLVRKRLPERSPAAVEYYLVAGIGGVAGPVLVLLHALPHLPIGTSAPILMIAAVMTGGFPAIRRGRILGIAAVIALIAMAALLARELTADAMVRLAAAGAASIASGIILRASLASRPAGDDLIRSMTGIAIAATAATMVIYMTAGDVIDFAVDWDAGASLIPVMVALGLAETGIGVILLRRRPDGHGAVRSRWRRWVPCSGWRGSMVLPWTPGSGSPRHCS